MFSVFFFNLNLLIIYQELQKMQRKFDLSVYLSEVSATIKLLRSEPGSTGIKIEQLLTKLDNYLDQVRCIKKSTVFEEDKLLDAESKLLFKVNQLVCEKMEEIESILLVINLFDMYCKKIYFYCLSRNSVESHLISMTRECESLSADVNSGESYARLLTAMININKTFWLK